MSTVYNSSEYSSLVPKFDTNRNKWGMESPSVRNVSYLFDSEEKALAFKESELNRLIRQELYEKELAENKAKVAAHIASYGKFLSSNPRAAGLQMKVLDRKFRFRNSIKSRKEILEQLIGEGNFISDYGLQNPDGSYLELNKTEREYATYLIRMKIGIKIIIG